MSSLPTSLEPAREEEVKTVPDIVQRYLSGESLAVLALENRKSVRTIYNWLLAECGEQYDSVVTQALVNRIADADLELESAASPLQVSRAREMARFARMDLERRRPKLYGPQTQHQHNTAIQVIVQRETPQQVVVEAESPKPALVSPQEYAEGKA